MNQELSQSPNNSTTELSHALETGNDSFLNKIIGSVKKILSGENTSRRDFLIATPFITAVLAACGPSEDFSIPKTAGEWAEQHPDDPSAQQAAAVGAQNDEFFAKKTAQAQERQDFVNSVNATQEASDQNNEPTSEIVNSNISNFTIPEGYAGTLSNIVYDELNCQGGAYLVLLVRKGSSSPDTAEFFDNGEVGDPNTNVYFEPGAIVYLGENGIDRNTLITKARNDGHNLP